MARWRELLEDSGWSCLTREQRGQAVQTGQQGADTHGGADATNPPDSRLSKSETEGAANVSGRGHQQKEARHGAAAGKEKSGSAARELVIKHAFILRVMVYCIHSRTVPDACRDQKRVSGPGDRG